MRKNAKKYIIVLFAVMMSAALFFMTALADAEVTAESALGSSSGSVSVKSSSSSKVSSEPESPPPSDGNGGVDVPSEEETVPVKLDYSDGSAVKIVNVKQGAHVSSLPVRARKGYIFKYWTMKGVRVSSSFEIYSEITLTAQWEASAASSRKPSSYASVDTHQREVERAASQAEGAISDPDVLSSQDWNSLLSAGQQASSGVRDPSSQTSSSSAKGGGGSWLFPVGIALIVLSACGIGAFVYLQFFSGPGPRGPGAGSGPDDSDGMEFTDISSSSTGAYPAPPSKPSGPPKGKNKDDTMPIPPQATRLREQNGHDLSRSQAKPVDGENKDFDWDKFFNDDI